jgi:hypothetical protein
MQPTEVVDLVMAEKWFLQKNSEIDSTLVVNRENSPKCQDQF